MIQVACFCGCRYSFDGEIGTCPACGDSAGFPRASKAVEKQMSEELKRVLKDAESGPQAP